MPFDPQDQSPLPGSARVVPKGSLDEDLTDHSNHALRVNVIAGPGGSGGTSANDNTAVSAGTPIMAQFADGLAALASGFAGVLRATAYRALHVNMRDSDGTERKPLTNAELRATAVPVTPSLPTNAAQESGGHLASMDTKTPSTIIGKRPVLSGWPAAGERFRYDFPASFASGTLYIGWNTSASALVTDTTWTVRRVVFDANGNPNDDQVQSGIAWGSRSAGWAA